MTKLDLRSVYAQKLYQINKEIGETSIDDTERLDKLCKAKENLEEAFGRCGK